MSELSNKKCVPCEGGTSPLTDSEVSIHLEYVDDWSYSSEAKKISKEFKFKDFAEALAFANKIGAIAESEGHHPDLFVAWGKVGVELTTHAIGGVSENDFILAAKIDEIKTPMV